MQEQVEGGEEVREGQGRREEEESRLEHDKQRDADSAVFVFTAVDMCSPCDGCKTLLLRRFDVRLVGGTWAPVNTWLSLLQVTTPPPPSSSPYRSAALPAAKTVHIRRCSARLRQQHSIAAAACDPNMQLTGIGMICTLHQSSGRCIGGG